MEDAHICSEIELPCGGTAMLFGVFDGHGGAKVSKFIAKKFESVLTSSKEFILSEKYKEALDTTFLALDAKIGKFSYCKDQGSTCCVVFVTKEKIYCANAGDSRAILVKKNINGDPVVVELSSDHKP